MRHFRTYTAFALAFLTASIPNLVYGAGLTTIIPQSGVCKCDTAPDWGCVLQVIQNIINDVVYLGVILCVIWIAYAGFSMMISGGNATAKSIAKTRLLNAVVGIAVILCSWIIIDFVMKTIYEPQTAFEGKNFGPWNSILASNGHDYCIQATTPSAITSGSLSILFGKTPGTYSSGSNAVGVAKPPCAASNTACSPEVLKRDGLSDKQALAMSCIAVTESGGDPHTPDSDTGACGLFQLTNKTSAGNWRQAKYHRAPCSTSSSCNDATCNRQAALLMFKEQGYQPWTGKNANGTHWNSNAVACVAKYDPGH